jgi:hypothetical protein
MTSIANAVPILRSQEMHPGTHGLCGAGIYFGDNPSTLRRKAHAQGVTLSVEVDLGKIMIADKARCKVGEDWAGILDRRDCDSVRCIGIASGDEYVVYDPARVKSIQLYTSSQHFYTGTLQKSADGSAGTGKSFTHYLVRIVNIHEKPSNPYPVLLGDGYSDKLGYANPSSLVEA